MSCYKTALYLIAALLTFTACNGGEETGTAVIPTDDVAATGTSIPATATARPPTGTPVPPTATAALATSTPEPVAVTVDPIGYWTGAISVSGVVIDINVTFTDEDGGLAGTIDIPQQGAAGLALANVTLDGDQIHFEIDGVGASFDGTVTAQSISGAFMQGTETGTFSLVAAEPVIEVPPEPAGDLPYTVTAVSWAIDDIVVEGTLTLPAGTGPFEAIIMVAGSGPTDRDWNSPLLPGRNGSAALFADALTRAGYVTLRYDKRVSGPNALANVEKMLGQISLQSHLDEVAGGVALLADRDDVAADRIFALANSEGTLHVLNYQRGAPATPLAGLILAAPPGQPLVAVLRAQIAQQLTGVPGAEEIMTHYDEAIARFLAGEPVAPDPAMPAGIRQLLLGFEAPANLPFTRELVTVDPADWLLEVDAPILVLIGQKDIQIDWQVDGARLEEAATGREAITFVYPENANHVFKFEEGSPDELLSIGATDYNAADRVLDETSLTAILAWLAER